MLPAFPRQIQRQTAYKSNYNWRLIVAVEPDQLRVLNSWFWTQGYWRSLEAYLELFQVDKNKAYAGEASVYYSHLPLATGVAERIRQFNPNARLIYIMRDPIKRTISHYWHRVIYDNECRLITTAIINDHQYRDVSHYAAQLLLYYDRFKSSNIRLLTLEELIKNYDETAKSIFAWLKIDEFVALPPLKPENQTPSTVKQRLMSWDTMLGFLRQNYGVSASIDLVPRSIRNYCRQKFTREINRSNVDIEPVMRYLQPLQREQTKELSALTGRDFREWKMLNP